ncbi:MAG TPA: pyrroline-5-carboxylate reductase [Capsulimonadaceae bacterium]|nr:pyrroline-5-carboxylate reductase [Capsulimonadaceae bacterium]
MLSENRLAVLGVGMMGGALARGLVRAGAIPADHITLFDPHRAKLEQTAAELGNGEAHVADSAREAAAGADVVLVAVKPWIVAPLLTQVAPALTQNHLLISIAGGVRISKMEEIVGGKVPVIRSMPNTPALIGEGVTAIARGNHANDAHFALADEFFTAVGKTVEVEERLLDAVTGLSGSGPAYVYLLIEALMDGGVKAGLTRDTARLLAAQTVFGAAKMVLDSDDHPAQLRDNVTTPGGTTIAGLTVLERAGIRVALMDAIEAAAQRSREMS